MARYRAVSEGFTIAPFPVLAEKESTDEVIVRCFMFALMSTCDSDLELVSHANSNDVVGNVA
jgi:hypothetical protein